MRFNRLDPHHHSTDGKSSKNQALITRGLDTEATRHVFRLGGGGAGTGLEFKGESSFQRPALPPSCLTTASEGISEGQSG